MLLGRAVELALVCTRVARMLLLELGKLLVLGRLERLDLLGRFATGVLDALCPV